MILKQKIYIFLLVTFFLIVNVQSKKLLMVQQLFRHGARYPIYINKNDYSEYASNEKSVGELTNNGKKMHYLLGKTLFDQYWGKLFDNTPYYETYNQSKFFVKSTDVNRTIQSVQSHLMGLFEKLPQLKIPPNLTQYSNPQWPGIYAQQGDIFTKAIVFHPTSIHVQKTGDFLRFYSPQFCPNQDNWQRINQKSDRITEISKNPRFQTAISALAKQLKKDKLQFFQTPKYYDSYQCEKYMGRPHLKVYQNQEYQRSLNFIYTLDLYINLFYTQTQRKATATGFFNATINNMKNIIKSIQNPQWVIYSAHDTTVGNMLAALNLTNVQCIYDAFNRNLTRDTDTCVFNYPLYTANLIFELHELDDKSHAIKIRYNGIYKQIPFCNWQQQCPVQTFYAWFQSFKDQKYVSTCGIKNQTQQTYFSIMIIEFGIIFSILLMAAIKYLKAKVVKSEPQHSKFNSSKKEEENQQNQKVKPIQQKNQMRDTLLSEQKDVQ